MKTTMNWLLLLLSYLIIGIGSFWAGEANYRNKLRTGAGLERIAELEQLDSLHRAQAAYYQRQAQQEQEWRENVASDYADSLAAERKRKPRMITVPVVRLMECDSAISVGQSFARTVEIQRLEIIELREVIALSDTANDELGNIIEAQEQRHLDDQQELKETKAALEDQKKHTKRWRNGFLVSTGTAVGLLLLLFL